jgi:hypothetical protein
MDLILRQCAIASMAVMTIRIPITTPAKRLNHSIQASVRLKVRESMWAGSCETENGGNQRPKHLGQSGQPRPAPETRTRPPANIRK